MNAGDFLMPSSDERYTVGCYRRVPMWDGLEVADHPLANAAYEGARLGIVLLDPLTCLLERAGARGIAPDKARAAYEAATAR